ncbi:TetR/AcrR family transcriptional regulator [Streptomyces pseudovenezuelae]|uniref:AcrR family transcriptional regulator n=1 Tax=Streptomyces pseudovenezuelae TaxID=67350 RepID=A0ABT6LYJ6_9ACTN|nr:TetR/AcrR family transcriptional regulator [Streptomyces pseudovenezuelae]MDH6221367.1 AcrR family transcriptional regulator [Streptomyces pseudovenezuelae]
MSTPGKRETGGRRSLRADARTNRERILSVAEEVFGKGGQSASTEEVARLADVGIATVFRHFPTKAALLEAVLVQRFDRLREQAETQMHATDPGAAFFDFFSHLVADAAGKIAIGEALLDAGGDNSGDAAQASDGLRRAVGALLQQAQRAGAVRDDVELPEVYALLVATSRASAHAHLQEEVRARMLTIVFDGLAPQRKTVTRRSASPPGVPC